MICLLSTFGRGVLRFKVHRVIENTENSGEKHSSIRNTDRQSQRMRNDTTCYCHLTNWYSRSLRLASKTNFAFRIDFRNENQQFSRTPSANRDAAWHRMTLEYIHCRIYLFVKRLKFDFNLRRRYATHGLKHLFIQIRLVKRLGLPFALRFPGRKFFTNCINCVSSVLSLE